MCGGVKQGEKGGKEGGPHISTGSEQRRVTGKGTVLPGGHGIDLGQEAEDTWPSSGDWQHSEVRCG